MARVEGPPNENQIVVVVLKFRWAQGDSTDERMATMGDGIGSLITLASRLLEDLDA